MTTVCLIAANYYFCYPILIVKFMPALKSLFSITLCLLILGCYYKPHFKKAEKETVSESKLPKADRMDLAMEQEFMKTRNVETNMVPREKLWEAQAYQQLLFGRQHKAAISGITWKERGPNNVGGRTRAILWDRNDPLHKTVFVAGVAGGLWKTTNIFAPTVTWTKVSDLFDNIAICAIAQDPTRPDTIYFGTGEGYFNSDGVQGNGIWKSTDGGSTFSVLSSTVTSDYSSCSGTGACDFAYVNKLVVTSSGTVIAACRGYYTNTGGVMRSTDAGGSFTRIFPSSSPYYASDLEIAANGDIYASIGLIFSTSSDNGIWKSTNDGASFTKVYTADVRDRRIEIACAPSNSNYIYAIAQGNSTNRARVVMKSTNAGSSWSNISVPTSVSASDTFTGTQAWYNLLLSVDQRHADSVIMGGIDIYKTTNGGTSWSQITQWSGSSYKQPIHSDQHIAAFRRNSKDTLLIGQDGGLFLITDFSATTPTLKNVNYNYNITQFYSCAMHPDRYSNTFLGGTQDNGTHQFLSAGINQTGEVIGGDGAFCHIDHYSPSYQFGAYTNSYFYRSTDGGKTFTSFSSNSSGKFINPTDYDSKDKILYAGYTSGNFRRSSGLTGTITNTNISAGFSGQVSAVTVDTFNAHVVYFGTDAGKIYRVTSANGTPSVSDISDAGMSGDYITCIAIDRKNSAHLLATISNYGSTSVYESTNSGGSWASVEGNLPDMPVRWAMFSPLGGDSALLGTELGVWTTTNLNSGGTTDWATSNNGLANVRVDMIRFRPKDSLIIAATHGRGMFTSDIFTTAKVDFGSESQLTYIGETVQFFDDSYKATSWAWDFENDGVTDATIQNPTFAYGTSGLKTVKLTINGSLVKTRTDYIQVLPNMATPYTTSDGGNFDDDSKAFHFGSKANFGNVNLWERGVPSNALTTVNSGTKAWKTDLDADIIEGDYQCALYSPNYNFTTAGTYTLSFRKSMEVGFCNAPMAVQVQYSTNKGQSWTRLGVNGSGTSWYNNYSGVGGCAMATPIFTDQYGWIGGYSNSSTSYDVSFLAGNSSVAFRVVMSVVGGYSASGYTVDGFMVDDFTISGPSNSALSADIETAVSEQTQPLGASATVDYYSPNGKYLATLKNNSSHNYGNTKVEIDNAGIGTTNFNTNTTTSKRILQKTIKITPTNANSSGDVDITMYFSATEIDSFEATTGYSVSTMNLIKTAGSLLTTGTIANTTYGNSPVVASHLDGNKVTANFTTGFSGLGGGKDGGSGPLPVTWLSFNGKRNVNEVALTWKTGSEINNSHFEIERMIDGETGFINVGLQTGKGTINQISTYGFKDVLPAATNGKAVYYRLKQVDYNGKFEYSNIIILRYNNDIPVVSVYPNPGNKTLNIEVGSLEKENLSVQVFNQNGAKVFESKLVNTINSFNMEKYSSGLYLITIYSNDEPILNEKWIKE